MSIVMYTASTKRLASLNVLHELKNRNKNYHHIVVTPDRCAFNIEKMLFDLLSEDAFFDIDVMTITRLCHKRLKDISSKKLLSKQSAVAIIKRLLLENKDKLTSFKNVVEYTGFAEELFETIALYKSCNISYNDVYVDESKTTALNFKQKDIKLIYQLYEEYLKDVYTDSFNQLNLYAECIGKDTYSNTIFYFIESDDYTSQAYNIISKFAKYNQVYIGVPYAPKTQNNKNIYTNKLYYDVVELAKLNNIDFIVKESIEYASDIKNYLSKNLLSINDVGAKDFTYSEYLKIVSYESMEDEIKNTMQNIKYRVINSGLSFDQFCVVVPGINLYEHLITKYAHEYDIPCYLDVSENMSEHYISRLIFSYFKIMQKDYSVDDVLLVISNPFLNISKNALYDYKNYVDKFGVNYADLFKTDDDCISIELKDILAIIYNDMTNYNNILSINEWLETISKSLDFIIFNHKDEYFSSDYLKDNLSLYNSSMQLIKKMENITHELGQVFCDYKCDFKLFFEIYKSYFESSSISMPPITSNTLFIADSNSSFLGDVDYVYVLGANEGNFPAYKMDMGLLTDRDISLLPNSKKIEPTIRYINRRSKFNIFELMFLANRSMVISYVNQSLDGSKMYMSSVVDSLLSILKLDPKMYNINGSALLDYMTASIINQGEDYLVYNNYNIATLKYNFVTALKKWQTSNFQKHYLENLNVMYSVLSQFIDVDAFIKNSKFSNVLPRLKDASGLFFKSNKTSVSQIETYYHCPYQHYVRYGLRLKEKEWSEVRPLDNGNILHDFLYVVVHKIVKSSNISLEEVKALAKKTILQVLKMDKYRFITDNPLNNVAIRSLTDEAIRVAVAIYEQNKFSSFIPSYYELEFSKENSISISSNNSKIYLVGKIDRVDVCDDGFRVIDYKTGDNSFSNYTDLVSGKKLQLIVYMKAFKDKEHLSPMGAFYFPISNEYLDKDASVSKKYTLRGVIENSLKNIMNMDNNMSEPAYTSSVINLKTNADGSIYNSTYYKNMCVTDEDIDTIIDFSINMCKKAIDNILGGDISITPLKDKKPTCSYCLYKGICNYSKLYGNSQRKVSTIKTVEELKGVENSGI